MARKFNMYLATEMVKHSSSAKSSGVDYISESNAIYLFQVDRAEYGSFEIVRALELVGYYADARIKFINGIDRIAIKIF